MADANFLTGVIRCPRCKHFNEFVIWDGVLIRQETRDETGKVTYSYDDQDNVDNVFTISIEKRELTEEKSSEKTLC